MDSREVFEALLASPEGVDDRTLRALVRNLTPEQLTELVEALPMGAVKALLPEVEPSGTHLASSPLVQARLLDEGYVSRPHLELLSNRLARAVARVERGHTHRMAVMLPPRTGKTRLGTIDLAAWILAKHPDWPIVLTSHDSQLSTSWSRQVRRYIEEGRLGSHVKVRRDAGAVSSWETTRDGKVMAVSTRASLTGRGAKVLIIDDPHKDFIEAYSVNARQAVWDWWLTVAQTRLEPPYLVVVSMARWHGDDLIGRLLSAEHEGDPADWEVIRIPAISTGEGDPLRRPKGQALLTPLIEETEEEALARWEQVRKDVGTPAFQALYQQDPVPPKGAIFDTSWWRYWSLDPSKATQDGRVVHLDPSTLASDYWVDSCDMSFKDTSHSSYVVFQRWVKHEANRYLIAQVRDRMNFPTTLKRFKEWCTSDQHAKSPYGKYVHKRLVEDKANGPAIIASLQKKVPGLKPITPQGSKEARAWAVTPECESGNVYLPHPTDPGNEWVMALISELRLFPRSDNDDQVDGLTQALLDMRDARGGGVSVPGRRGAADPPERPSEDAVRRLPGRSPAGGRSIARAATTDRRRSTLGGQRRSSGLR